MLTIFLIVACLENAKNIFAQKQDTQNAKPYGIQTSVSVQAAYPGTIGLGGIYPIAKPINPRLSFGIGRATRFALDDIWVIAYRKNYVFYGIIGIQYWHDYKIPDVESRKRMFATNVGIGNLVHIGKRFQMFVEGGGLLQDFLDQEHSYAANIGFGYCFD